MKKIIALTKVFFFSFIILIVISLLQLPRASSPSQKAGSGTAKKTRLVCYFWGPAPAAWAGENIQTEEKKVWPINIDEATRLGLENNFAIQLFRLDKSISEKELLKAQAVYDTTFGLSCEYDEDRLKRSSIIAGTKNTSLNLTSHLSRRLPAGTILSLGLSHQRQRTDSAFSALNPIHEIKAGISITQPLGKNAGGVLDKNNVRITELNIEAAGYTSADKIEAELAEIQKAYWNLLLAGREEALAQEMLAGAKELSATHKRNFELGTVEAPEFYASEANLKEKEQGLVLAADNLNSALNLLRFRLNLAQKIVLVPQDDFATGPIKGTFEEILATALSRRRDYKIAQNALRRQDLSLAIKKNSLRPQLDLTASFTRNALDERFSSSISRLAKEDYPEYTIGLVFSMPLENRAARAGYSQQQIEKAKALINLKKIESLILSQVHEAYGHLQSMFSSVELLREARELQGRKFRAEKERFNRGRSDTDRLIRYQNDYLRSKIIYLRSLYNYQSAFIDLKLFKNTLLDEAQKLL